MAFEGLFQSLATNQNALAQSTRNAQTTFDQALANAAIAQGFQAPQNIVVPGVSAPQLTGNYLSFAPTAAQAVNSGMSQQSYQAALAEAMDASQQMQRAPVTNVAPVQGPIVGAVNTQIRAPTIGDAAQTGQIAVEGSKIGAGADALRAQQIASANSIANAPSAAASQFQAAQSQVVSDQLAMAAQARGSERAGARREAIIAAGQQGAQAGLSAAALSAQEEQAKRTAAAAALSGIRSQDVTTATAQAQLDSQRSQLQAQLNAAIAQGNTAAINDIQKQQAQLELSAKQSSVQASLAQQSTMAGAEEQRAAMAQQSAMANAAAANKSAADYASAYNTAAQQTAQNVTAVREQNAAAQTKAAADYAAAMNTSANQFATNATQTNLANVQTAQQQAQTNAARTLAADTTNANNALQANAASQANSLTAQTASANNQLSAQSLRNQGSNAALGTGVSAANVQSANAATSIGASNAQAQRDQAQTGAIISAAGTLGAAALMSDERTKDDIAPIGEGRGSFSYAQFAHDGDREEDKRRVADMSPEDVQNWAEHINRPITFRYKPGVEDSGESPQIGLSANRVEAAGPLGRLMVHKDENGMRSLDYRAATLMLAKAAFDRASEAYEASKRGAR